MRSTIWRPALTALALATLSVAITTAVAGQDMTCEERLRNAPVETAQLPDGWSWDFFTLERYGTPSFQAAIDANGFAVNLELACVNDPGGLFDRIKELQAAAANDRISVIEIGDESMANREFSEFPTIRWRHDDIVGLVRGCTHVAYGAMEDFALTVDALLP